MRSSAAVFRGPGRLDLEERDVPVPGEGEVLIRVSACGVCGTDFHIFRGEAPARPPVVLGHEFCGEVVAVGDGVPDSDLRPGDRVAVDPNMSCGTCRQCRLGRVHLCESMQALGVTRDGGFAVYAVAPAPQCHKLPSSVSDARGAFVEPVACCVHGIDLARVAPGQSVVVLGAGTIGLVLLQLARRSGATDIVVSEPIERKRRLALELGATAALDPSHHDAAPQILELLPSGADVVIEAVGRPETVDTAIRVAARGGCVLLFGVSPEGLRVPVSPFDIYKRELRVQGSYVNPHTSSRAIALLASGAVNVDPLVERVAPLKELPALLARGPSRDGAKVLVSPQ